MEDYFSLASLTESLPHDTEVKVMYGCLWIFFIYRCNFASPSFLYRYFDGRCLGMLHDREPGVSSTNTILQVLRIPLVLLFDINHSRCKFRTIKLFTKTNNSFHWCYPTSYKIKFFKSKVNECLISPLIPFIFPSSFNLFFRIILHIHLLHLIVISSSPLAE